MKHTKIKGTLSGKSKKSKMKMKPKKKVVKKTKRFIIPRNG